MVQDVAEEGEEKASTDGETEVKQEVELLPFMEDLIAKLEEQAAKKGEDSGENKEFTEIAAQVVDISEMGDVGISFDPPRSQIPSDWLRLFSLQERAKQSPEQLAVFQQDL